jgi:hypothetical protein
MEMFEEGIISILALVELDGDENSCMVGGMYNRLRNNVKWTNGYLVV